MTEETLKPLGKPAYWVKTIRDLEMLLKKVGMKPTSFAADAVHTLKLDRSDQALARMPLAEKARYLHALGYALYAESLDQDYDRWGNWWQVKRMFRDQYQIGSMVLFTDAIFGDRYLAGVGQLLAVEPWGLRERYDQYGGPPGCTGNQYLIRTLDGNKVTWSNATAVQFPSHSHMEMCRQVHLEVRKTLIGN